MRTFMFRDVTDTLATGEKCNFLTVRARSRKSALQVIEQANNANIFTYFGKVFFAAATFTTSSKTLTLSGAFARYLLANSTRIVITSSTSSVVPGEYVIASRSSDNAIVLTADIGGTNPSDVDGYIIGGRTATLIERTYTNTPVGFPGVAGGLTKGTFPNDAVRGVLYEQYVAAT